MTSMGEAEEWAHMEAEARVIANDAYWRNRTLRAMRDTCSVLERYFDVVVTASDRMFINQYTRDFMVHWKKLSFKARAGASIDIPAEIAGKFLMVFIIIIGIRK